MKHRKNGKTLVYTCVENFDENLVVIPEIEK